MISLAVGQCTPSVLKWFLFTVCVSMCVCMCVCVRVCVCMHVKSIPIFLGLWLLDVVSFNRITNHVK